MLKRKSNNTEATYTSSRLTYSNSLLIYFNQLMALEKLEEASTLFQNLVSQFNFIKTEKASTGDYLDAILGYYSQIPDHYFSQTDTDFGVLKTDIDGIKNAYFEFLEDNAQALNTTLLRAGFLWNIGVGFKDFPFKSRAERSEGYVLAKDYLTQSCEKYQEICDADSVAACETQLTGITDEIKKRQRSQPVVSNSVFSPPPIRVRGLSLGSESAIDILISLRTSPSTSSS